MGLAQVITFESRLESLECATCAVVYAVPARLVEQARKQGNQECRIHCPHGHVNVWYESEVERLKRQLAEKESALQRANNSAAVWRSAKEEAERKANAQKAANTRLKKRVGNGVCPCCKRTFKQLSQHMAHKHPEYKDATA